VVYLFNLNFDASQLKHAGFNTDANKWYDIALLARLPYNYLSQSQNYNEVISNIRKIRN
jgi:hypothetical protein